MGIFCWTEALYHCWLERLEIFPQPTTRLEMLYLFDTNRMTWSEFETTLAEREYDLVILHGFQAAHDLDQLSEGYLKSVLRAVPSELIMWV